ncbi:MAG: extracellular solute-binding protein [Anaerolineae bacterium]|nr:extracellular solute-binding protein [Anaerolineae bacterium]
MKHQIFRFLTVLVVASLVLAACAAPAAVDTSEIEAQVAELQSQLEAASDNEAMAELEAQIADLQAQLDAAGEEAAEEEPAAEGQVELQYWLWDNLQVPAYQACADAFTEQNPNITITITQQGWSAYWDALTTGFVAGTAPDVFTDHLAKYPEFLDKGLLLDIEPYVVADSVDTSIYLVDPELWVKDGSRYGLPKDWDTIAIFYNMDMLEAAGVDPAELNDLTWNPQDGGTFQEMVARLTLDANGNNGLSPDFDKNNVVQWGFVSGPGDAGSGGQQQWSSFAASTGFTLTDGPWSTQYHYDDPRIAETLQWWADLHNVYNFAPGSDTLAGTDNVGIFQAGAAAMTTEGSWQITNLMGNSTFPVGVALLPTGPEGRKSSINGLSDGIWVGTEHPDEAWEWVKYLASPECANTVGEFGVVFPAQQPAVDKALAAHQAAGRDISAFTIEAAAAGGTYLLPMTEHGSDIAALVQPVLQDIYDGKVQAADVLPDLNEQINALFE